MKKLILGLVLSFFILLNAQADMGDLWSVADETGTYKMRIESDADINSGNQGGFKMPFIFKTADITTSTTEFLLTMVPSIGANSATTVKKYVMPFAGSVIGLSVRGSGNPTAGAVTFEAFINGTATGLTASWTQGRVSGEEYATQAKDTDAFSAGDALGVQMRTGSSVAPDKTIDVIATVIVEM